MQEDQFKRADETTARIRKGLRPNNPPIVPLNFSGDTTVNKEFLEAMKKRQEMAEEEYHRQLIPGDLDSLQRKEAKERKILEKVEEMKGRIPKLEDVSEWPFIRQVIRESGWMPEMFRSPLNKDHRLLQLRYLEVYLKREAERVRKGLETITDSQEDPSPLSPVEDAMEKAEARRLSNPETRKAFGERMQDAANERIIKIDTSKLERLLREKGVIL